MDNMNNKIQLSIAVDDVNKILQALSKLPYEQVVAVINDVYRQVNDQLQQTIAVNKE